MRLSITAIHLSGPRMIFFGIFLKIFFYKHHKKTFEDEGLKERDEKLISIVDDNNEVIVTEIVTEFEELKKEIEHVLEHDLEHDLEKELAELEEPESFEEGFVADFKAEDEEIPYKPGEYFPVKVTSITPHPAPKPAPRPAPKDTPKPITPPSQRKIEVFVASVKEPEVESEPVRIKKIEVSGISREPKDPPGRPTNENSGISAGRPSTPQDRNSSFSIYRDDRDQELDESSGETIKEHKELIRDVDSTNRRGETTGRGIEEPGDEIDIPITIGK